MLKLLFKIGLFMWEVTEGPMLQNPKVDNWCRGNSRDVYQIYTFTLKLHCFIFKEGEGQVSFGAGIPSLYRKDPCASTGLFLNRRNQSDTGTYL